MSAMNVRQTRFIHLATAAVVLSLCVAGRLAGQSATTDWPSYNRTLTSERYAPLDQIDKNNVASLRQVMKAYAERGAGASQTAVAVAERKLRQRERRAPR